MTVGFNGLPKSVQPRTTRTGLIEESDFIGRTSDSPAMPSRWPNQEMPYGIRSSVSKTHVKYHTYPAIRQNACVFYNDLFYIFGGQVLSHYYGNYYTNEMWTFDPYRWEYTYKGEQSTVARGFHGMCVYDDKMWVFGGRNSSVVAFDSLWAYSFLDGTWTQMALGSSTTPRKEFGGKIVVYNGKFYVWGGRNDSDAVLTSLYEYNVSTDTWTELPNGGTSPAANYEHVMWAYDNKIWVSHGRNHTQCWYYDLASSGPTYWTQMPSPSRAMMSGCSAIVVGNKAVVLGGFDNNNISAVQTRNMIDGSWEEDRQGAPNNRLWGATEFLSAKREFWNFGGYDYQYNDRDTSEPFLYNFDADRWFQVGERAMHSRMYAKAAAYNGKIYISTGEMETRTQENILTSSWIEEIDPKLNKTRFIRPDYYMERGRGRPVMQAYNGEIFIIGGSNFSWFMGWNTVYNLDKNMWYYREPLPFATDAAASALYAGKIYYYGGSHGSNSDLSKRLYVYDISADTWTRLADCEGKDPNGTTWSRPVRNHEMCAHAGKLYSVFGYGNSADYQRYVYVYDMATNKWMRYLPTYGASEPEYRRQYFLSWCYRGGFFIAGGWLNASDGADVWRLDLNRMHWTRQGDLASPANWDMCGAMTEDGRFYFTGGRDNRYYPTPEALFVVYDQTDL